MSGRCAIALLAACVFATVAVAEPVEELLLRARQAEYVKGDFDLARKLYRAALPDKSLDRARQAVIRLRIAHCFIELGEEKKASRYLEPSIYERSDIPRAVRDEAERMRGRLRPRVLPPRKDETTRAQREADVRERVANHLAEARRHLGRNRLMAAHGATQKALALAPESTDAKALDAQIQTRLSGVSAFVASPLAFLKAWSAARVKSVARDAREHMKAGLRAFRGRDVEKGEREFGLAIALIDGCEFADASTDLLDLREAVREHWREQRARRFGAAKAEPRIPVRTRVSTPAADYLRQLQRMLDVLSSPEHEYRLMPIASGTRATIPRGRRKPRGFVLEHDAAPSRWSLARFARAYLAQQVEPTSWTERGNFLDTAGDMLVARNRPAVLDRMQAELKLLESPSLAVLPSEFLLISVPTPLLKRFARQFGEWKRGPDAILTRVIPARIEPKHIAGWLRDENVDVRLDRDRYTTFVGNGQATTLLAGRSITEARGYADAKVTTTPAFLRTYGVLLDLLPWRMVNGSTAVTLSATVRQPAPPMADEVPRFLSQVGETYEELPAGSTLAISGFTDPFAAARAEGAATGRSLLVLWRFPGKAQERGDDAGGSELDLSMRKLLYDVHADDPGPRRHETLGFAPTPRVDTIRARAKFLSAQFDRLLPDTQARLDLDKAVLRVPQKSLTQANTVIEALEREARRTFAVEVKGYVVRTSAFQLWMARNEVKLKRWGDAQVALLPTDEARAVLAKLPAATAPDPFAPEARWSVRGLQLLHLRATRTRTVPAEFVDDDLPQSEVATVTEGIVLGIRPYLWAGRNIRADIRAQTATLEVLRESANNANNSVSIAQRIGGVSAAGEMEFGTRSKPITAIVCRIPHPTESRPKSLTELVFSVRVTLR